MLPALKRKEGGVSATVETKVRKPDEGSEPDLDMLGAIAEDLLAAIEAKDASGVKGALEALVEHVQSVDEKQDQQMKES